MVLGMTVETIADRLKHRNVGLALSAGFFGFYHQAGVLDALLGLGIRPAAVAGNSAGALVGAMFASGLSAGEIKQSLLSVRRSDFWDAGWPFSPNGFGILAGHRFKALLGRILATHSFETCPVPLTVGLYEVATGRMRHVSEGPLIPAVYASSALPYLFQPEEMDGVVYWDGGFFEKTALIPFLSNPDIDTVVVSYLPQRNSRERTGLGFLPTSMALFAEVPFEERLERDRAGIECLKRAGKEVVIVAPEPVKLGPFSMERARSAYDRGRTGALSILNATNDSVLGARDLAL